jgi:hypothetical protein
MRVLLALGVLLLGSGAAAFASSAALRGDSGPARAAARSALVASAVDGSTPTSEPLAGDSGRARYWWSVAGFERAVGPGRASRTARLDRLAGVSEELIREAAHGSRPSRSLSLSLLGLTRLAHSYLGTNSSRGGGPNRSPAAALRAAVVLDPANDDAKANLELILQTTAPRPGARRPSPSRNQSRQPGGAPNPQPGATPATGAGGSIQGAPVGY